jgi:imidazolonepropionase-like amidohydrolase
LTTVMFRGARVFDGCSESLRENCDVLVREGTIADVSDSNSPAPEGADIVECNGRTLMPGLIDAHVHVYASSVDLRRTADLPSTYLAHVAAQFLAESLNRGFTTVRDVGGADAGLALALKEEIIVGPRLFFGGRVLSQTGGHGDLRAAEKVRHAEQLCACACESNHFATIADGVDAVRRTVRDEIRQGASHIKLMGSGGVVSPTDPLDRCQYSDEEIRAAVEEADRAGRYVAAHCHPDEAILRCAQLGVRSIEHATLISDNTAAVLAKKGTYVVPTMATIFGLLEYGPQLGLPEVSMSKLRLIADRALSSLEVMRRAGVQMGFGTDLLGSLQSKQSSEFSLRARALPAIDILRSVCEVNAALLKQDNVLGCIRKGAAADLVIVDGNPLEDISILSQGGKHLCVIMKGGRFHKRCL